MFLLFTVGARVFGKPRTGIVREKDDVCHGEHANRNTFLARKSVQSAIYENILATDISLDGIASAHRDTYACQQLDLMVGVLDACAQPHGSDSAA